MSVVNAQKLGMCALTANIGHLDVFCDGPGWSVFVWCYCHCLGQIPALLSSFQSVCIFQRGQADFPKLACDCKASGRTRTVER